MDEAGSKRKREQKCPQDFFSKYVQVSKPLFRLRHWHNGEFFDFEWKDGKFRKNHASPTRMMEHEEYIRKEMKPGQHELLILMFRDCPDLQDELKREYSEEQGGAKSNNERYLVRRYPFLDKQRMKGCGKEWTSSDLLISSDFCVEVLEYVTNLLQGHSDPQDSAVFDGPLIPASQVIFEPEDTRDVADPQSSGGWSDLQSIMSQLRTSVRDLGLNDGQPHATFFARGHSEIEPFRTGDIVVLVDESLWKVCPPGKIGVYVVVCDEHVKQGAQDERGHWCVMNGVVPVRVEGSVQSGQHIGWKLDGSGAGIVVETGCPAIGVAISTKLEPSLGEVRVLCIPLCNSLAGEDRQIVQDATPEAFARLEYKEQRLEAINREQESKAGCAVKPSGLGLLAFDVPSPPRHTQDIFFDDNSQVSARDVLLRDLRKYSRIVVCGMPGIGKTTLVSGIARNSAAHEMFPDGVLFAKVGQDPDILGTLRLLMRQLKKGVTNDEKDRTVAEWRQEFFESLRTKRTLIILDDIWERNDAVKLVSDELSNGVCVLVTSRTSNLFGATSDFRTFKVNPWREEMSLNLIKAVSVGSRSGSGGLTSSDEGEEHCLEVVRMCGGNPLAITIAGALKKELDWTWKQLQVEISDNREKFMQEAPDLDEAGPILHSIDHVIALSVKRLSTDCVRTLRQMAMLSAPIFDRSFAVLWGSRWASIFKELTNRSLAIVSMRVDCHDYDRKLGAIELHDLVRDWSLASFSDSIPPPLANSESDLLSKLTDLRHNTKLQAIVDNTRDLATVLRESSRGVYSKTFDDCCAVMDAIYLLLQWRRRIPLNDDHHVVLTPQQTLCLADLFDAFPEPFWSKVAISNRNAFQFQFKVNICCPKEATAKVTHWTFSSLQHRTSTFSIDKKLQDWHKQRVLAIVECPEQSADYDPRDTYKDHEVIMRRWCQIDDFCPVTGQPRLHPTARMSLIDGEINTVSFNSNASILASGGSDFKISQFRMLEGVWDEGVEPNQTLSEIRSNHTCMERDRPQVTKLVLSPDGKLAGYVTFCAGRSLHTHSSSCICKLTICQTSDWAEVKVVSQSETGGLVYSMAFSPDGKLLATGIRTWNLHGAVLLWDTSNWQLQSKLYVSDNDIHASHPVESLCFNHQGIILASTSRKVINLWNVPDSCTSRSVVRLGLLDSRKFQDGMGRVEMIAFNLCGSLLASAHEANDDSRIFLWGTASWEVVFKLDHPRLAEIKGICFLSSDILILVSRGSRYRGGWLRGWDLPSKSCVAAYYSDKCLTCLDVRQKWIAAGDDSCGIHLLSWQDAHG